MFRINSGIVKTNIFLSVILLNSFFAGAQSLQRQHEFDSLKNQLGKVNDTTKVIVWLTMARIKLDNPANDVTTLAKRAIELSKTLEYENGLALGYTFLGSYYSLYKNDFDQAKDYLDSAEVQNASPVYRRVVYHAFSIWYSQRGAFDKSHSYLAKALDANGSLEDDTTAVICDVMGYNLNKIGRKAESIYYYKKSIRIYEKNARKEQVAVNLAATLNNLGVVYIEMNALDSALNVFKRLYDIEKNYGNPLDNPGLLSNLGKLYLQKGEDDTAYYFMHAALRAPSALGTPYAYRLCLSTLGRYHLHHNPDSALYYGKAVLRLIKNDLSPALEDAYYILAEAYNRKNRFDSAFYFQKKYLQYHDSVFQEETSRKIAELEATFDLERKEKEIQHLKEARQNELFRSKALASGLGLTIVMALLIFYFLRMRMRARKKEIELKNSQLESYTRSMIEKSALVEELRAQIEHLQANDHPDKGRIESLSLILNTPIITETHWEEFKALFEEVYPDFFAELKIRFPFLSAGEVRLSALLKLNLNTREIANMLGISMESANKARYRLRKKLDLHPEQDLSDVIGNVSVNN